MVLWRHRPSCPEMSRVLGGGGQADLSACISSLPSSPIVRCACALLIGSFIAQGREIGVVSEHI